MNGVEEEPGDASDEPAVRDGDVVKLRQTIGGGATSNGMDPMTVFCDQVKLYHWWDNATNVFVPSHWSEVGVGVLEIAKSLATGVYRLVHTLQSEATPSLDLLLTDELTSTVEAKAEDAVVWTAGQADRFFCCFTSEDAMSNFQGKVLECSNSLKKHQITKAQGASSEGKTAQVSEASFSVGRRSFDGVNELETGEVKWVPDEILMKIFSHFSQYHLYSGIAPVCKQWHRLSDDSSFITQLDLSKEVNLETGALLFAKAKLLTELKLTNQSLVHDLLSIAEKQCSKLRSVEVKESSGFLPNTIRQLVKSVPNLERLVLQKVIVKGIDLSPISGLRSLRELGFRDSKIGDERQLVNIFASCSALKHIDLRQKRYFNDTMKDVFEAVRIHAAAQLKSIAFRCRFMGDDGTPEMLKQCQQLVNLSVCDYNGSPELFSEISTLPCLKRVRITFDVHVLRTFDGDHYFSTASHLSSLTHLEMLDLSKSDILQMATKCVKLRYLKMTTYADFSDDLMSVFIDNLVHLEELHLRLSSQENCHLLRFISILPRLQVLNIAYFQPEPSSTDWEHYFTSSSPQLSSLTTLGFTFCHLSAEALRSLANNCPNLQRLALTGCEGVNDSTLAVVIEKCANLRELHLKYQNGVTGTCFQGCPPALPKLRRLRFCLKPSAVDINSVVKQIRPWRSQLKIVVTSEEDYGNLSDLEFDVVVRL